eukprot:7382557-Prymnesium_polylepis.1
MASPSCGHLHVDGGGGGGLLLWGEDEAFRAYRMHLLTLGVDLADQRSSSVVGSGVRLTAAR